MVDEGGLNPPAERRVGSTPSSGTGEGMNYKVASAISQIRDLLDSITDETIPEDIIVVTEDIMTICIEMRRAADGGDGP